jgi:hypothetical protein
MLAKLAGRYKSIRDGAADVIVGGRLHRREVGCRMFLFSGEPLS